MGGTWSYGWFIAYGAVSLISSLAIPAAGFIPKTSPNTLSVCMGLLAFTQIGYAICLIQLGLTGSRNWDLYDVTEPLLGLGVLLTWLAAYLLVSLAVTPDRKSQNLVMGIMSFFAAVALLCVSAQIIEDGYYLLDRGVNSTVEGLGWLVIFVAAIVLALRRNKCANLSSSCFPQWQCFLMVGLVVAQMVGTFLLANSPFKSIITLIFKNACFCLAVRGAATCDLPADIQAPQAVY
jgi:hypothetical protein